MENFILQSDDTLPGQIGEQVKTGKTETRISLLAIRRVQLRIDRELKQAGRERTASL